MTQTKYEKLMGRFRLMMTNSGAFPDSVTNAELLEKAVGDTHEEKMHSIEKVVSLVPESYWRRQGL